MPMTANGKLDRKALPAPGIEQSATEEDQARTPVEEILCSIWADVLKVEGVGRQQDFFDLGGHSLLATQVVSRVREAFDVEVPLKALFERPTVAGLAEAVERERREGRRADAPPIVAVSRDRELPLSFAQQRLWFIHQLEPDSAAYNIPHAVRLLGRLQVAALAEALGQIALRHEVLRTRIEQREGRPHQVIDEAGVVELRLWDVSRLGETGREQQAREVARREGARAFDLERGPVWRAAVVKLSEEDHVLMLNIHHIASDGWSTGVLVREFTSLYEQYISGRQAALAELEVQYADYAVWQREWLQGEVLQEQIDYWRNQLEDASVLELPTDRPRPAVATHRGAAVPFTLSAELTQQLRQVSRQHGVTIFMTLLAAFQVVLSRYSRQDDVVVGTDVANRNRVETESLIGFFINQLVLRTDLSANPTFERLLASVRETTLGAYAHQDVPFEKLVEELQPERDLGRSPLFQVKLVLQNASAAPDAVHLPGLKLVPFHASTHSIKLAINLMLHESAAAVSGSLKYATDLFDEQTARRLADHFHCLIESATASPSRRVFELEMASASERMQILTEWNQAGYEVVVDLTIHEMFEQQAGLRPDAVAVVYEQEQISYGGLNEQANRLAHQLLELGVGPELRVALWMERGLELVVGLLGVLKAGAAYVPLDVEQPSERVAQVLEDSQSVVVLTQQRLRGRLPASWAMVIELDTQIGGDGWERIDLPASNPYQEVAQQGLAYVIYTSGTTGRPKGVAVEHRQVVNYVEAIAERLRLEQGWRMALVSTIAADLGHTMLYPSLCLGGELHVVSQEQARDGRLWQQYQAERQVECVKMTPSHVEALISAGKGVVGKRLVVGGEAFSSRLMKGVERIESGCEVYNHYGPTECTVGAVAHEVRQGEEEEVAIGKPLRNVKAYVIDGQQGLVPVGVKGELYIGGRGVARGYLGDAEQTARGSCRTATAGKKERGCTGQETWRGGMKEGS